MPTLDSGSVSLSRSADGDSVQTIWLVGRHSVLFTLDTTVPRCVTVAPLVMFLLAYFFDTCLLIFEGHASWSQCLGTRFMVGLRYHWVCRLGKIWNVIFYRLHWCGKCSASTGLRLISCFRHLFQSAKSGCTHGFLLGECIPVLQFCFKFNAGYSLTTHSSFVRLPNEFYVTNFMVAVAFDGWRK